MTAATGHRSAGEDNHERHHTRPGRRNGWDSWNGRDGGTGGGRPELAGASARGGPRGALEQGAHPVALRAAALDRHPGRAVPGDRVGTDRADPWQLHERDLGAGRMLSLIHISEPTRLGMISYAVFCLKK